MPTPSTAYNTPPMNFNGTPAPMNFRHKRADIVLNNGANNNIARNDANYLRVTGPSGAFSISGFDTPLSGMMLYVQVAISQQLTIKNKTASPVKNQIDTLTNADVIVTATPCIITFIYDASSQKWVYGGLQAKTAPASGNGSAKLSFIGKYLHNAVTSWSTYQQAMLGDYLFMVDPSANASLVCYDASDIHHLVFVSSLAITNLSFSGLAGAGKYLYCWSGTAGAKVFNVVDASNPYAMTVVGTLALGTYVFWGGHASVWSRSGSTYVTYTSTTGAVASNVVTTINVTTPATPTLVGNYTIPSEYAMVQDVDGRYVYVATYQGNVKVLDYSTPATPTVTGTVSLGAVYPNGDLVARQDYAYVSYTDTIRPINVSSKSSPVAGTGFLADPTGTGMEAVRMMFSGSYLVSLVTGGSDYGLTLYQITNPDVPTYVDRYDSYFLANFGAGAALQSIFVKDRFIYGAGSDEALNGAVFVFGF